MQHLFTAWKSLAEQVRASDHILLVTDYDGTLTPIVRRPQEAVLAPAVRSKLEVLACRLHLSIGIISGRALAELKGMVGIAGIYYAGNHGLEIEGAGLDFVSPPARKAQAVIRHLAGQLCVELGHIPGVIVEDKRLSLSVHYRMVAEGEVKKAENIFREATLPLLAAGKIRVTEGKKVWEVRPPFDWHKGKAVEVIIGDVQTKFNPARLTVIYLGDDVTDEDVFRILQKPQGWSVFVTGENLSSGAAYFLNSPAEVEELLSRLLELTG
ncbi:MAG: trehalose-phosphatase [Dehalococcoidales bacterium]|nr:trehalose-phosphatase [Dehalococcoidales bacterium]